MRRYDDDNIFDHIIFSDETFFQNE